MTAIIRVLEIRACENGFVISAIERPLDPYGLTDHRAIVTHSTHVASSRGDLLCVIGKCLDKYDLEKDVYISPARLGE